MNEKEILLNNIREAEPVMREMGIIENEISRLNIEKAKLARKNNGCLHYFLALIEAAVIIVCTITGIFIVADGESWGILLFIPVAIAILITILIPIVKKTKAKSIAGKIQELAGQHNSLESDARLSWLPSMYRTARCYNSIAGYLMNGRADTLKEALNLFETEQQRMANPYFR
ncbi:MAG: hypothetical protein NC340_06040 [Ruminococcus flavefaciens]|nr:hypothetical protein [Ruminococcus flavefaciens]MCM1231230.1 hypothetical protein [Ruminococcus flavefaciens]